MYEDVFSPALDVIKKEHPTINSIDKLIESAHDDLPLNDVGETRTIRFNALGSQWAIVFPNDYVTNSIAEEFCAMLQIALCEIALSEVDLHLMKGKINLELEIADKYLPAEQLPSIDEFKWKYFVYHFDNSDPIEIDKHMTHSFASLLLILNEISLLKFPKFRELFEKMFKRNEIARNTFSANVYQRMYRLIFSQTDFDSQQRLHFLPVQINAKISNQNEIMSWRKNVSEKYNKEESIEHIKERFKNSKKCIHVTLSELTQKKEFSDLINRLRSAGYLDWQIVLGMTNFVINYKARQQLSSKSFGSEEEYTRVLSKTFLDLFEKDEKECYVRFPIEAFESQEFRLNLDKYPVTILNTYNLHNKSRFPNLPAIKEFLDVRFNMRNDSTDEYNPLKDIPYMA